MSLCCLVKNNFARQQRDNMRVYQECEPSERAEEGKTTRKVAYYEARLCYSCRIAFYSPKYF